MRYHRFFVPIIAWLLFSSAAMAQTIYPWDDHIFPFCTDENPYGITYKSGTTGEAGFPQKHHVGCLNSTPGPVWYYMQIDKPGDLLIYIEQYSLIGHVLIDVDFACWGPFEAGSKRDFLLKLRNSYQLDVTPMSSHRPTDGDHSYDLGGYPYRNMVDCSYDPAGTEWCFIPNAKSGEWYLLLITNYSRRPGKIHFERVNAKSTATTRCDVTVPIIINPVPKDLLQIDEHTSAICLHDKKALVTIELETEEGFNLSKSSLRKAKANVFANGKTYKAILVDDHFECEIDIERDTTAYTAEIECPDPQFKLQTEKHYLVKTFDCLPGQIPLVKGDTVDAGGVDISLLKQGDTPFSVNLPDDGGYAGLNPEDYDVSVSSDNPLIEKVTASTESGELELTAQLRGDWCECFTPDSLVFSVQLTPKNPGAGLSPVEMPVKIAVEHHSAWITRCLWALITLAALLVFMIYLRALLKKNRFHRFARLRNSYYEDDSPKEIQKQGKLLRATGFLAWVDRWLNPFGDEKNTISFNRPKTKGLTFMASSSKNKVLLKESCFDPKLMVVPNYVPEPKDGRKKEGKPIGLTAGTSMEIKKTDGGRTTRLGHLKFVHEGKDDEGGYRVFIGLLLCLSALLFAALLFAMVKGLL